MTSEKILIGLVAASLVAACSGDGNDVGADAGTPDGGEIPDLCTAEAPCALAPGVRATEYIAPVGDSDPYTFEVPSAGRVIRVVVENDADFSPVRLQVALSDPARQALDNQRYVGNGRQRVELQLVAPAAGTYNLTISDVGDDAADRRNPYFVTVDVLSETDDNEPNDTKGAPTVLVPGAATSGTIGFQGDEDWFAVDVGSNQLIQIEVSAAATSDVRLMWSLFDPAGDVLIAESTQPEEGGLWPVENRAVGNAAGRYLLRVLDDPADGADADLASVYVLTVRLVAEPDAQEQSAPNDTPATATAVNPGQSVTGYVAATSDVDYYAVQVTSAPRLLRVRAQMASTSPVDLAFSVLTPDGETLICDARDGDLCRAYRFVRDGGEAAADLITAHVAETNGTYYVKVGDQQDNEFDPGTAYTVTIDLPPEPDANEDYALGGRDTAVVVAPSSTVGATLQVPWVEGYVSHAGDEDWYQLDLPGSQSLDPAQNGDWLVTLALQMPAPTPVELQAFFYGPEGSARESYQGYGKRCREPSPTDPMNCQFPDADNGFDVTFGESTGECFVVFREVTSAGPHYFRITDLDRDDFDVAATGRYRFRVTIDAGCPGTSVCSGVFTDNGGNDLCGRP